MISSNDIVYLNKNITKIFPLEESIKHGVVPLLITQNNNIKILTIGYEKDNIEDIEKIAKNIEAETEFLVQTVKCSRIAIGGFFKQLYLN